MNISCPPDDSGLVDLPLEDTRLALPRARKPRINSACLPCRRSKTKCDGQHPCARCADRGIMCAVGTPRKTTTKRKAKTTPPPARTKEGDHVEEGPRKRAEVNTISYDEESNLLAREVHCSISGSEASVSHNNMYYGPSSTFVFLQQLYRFLSERRDIGTEPISQKPLDAIRELNYSSIFFDTDSVIPASIVGLKSISFDTATSFLEMYLVTHHFVLPFCEPATLRALTYNAYSDQDLHIHESTSRDATLVMAVLALGATLTDELVLSHSLYQKAKLNIRSWGESASLRSVQILMLLSEFEQISGNPNAAWLTEGAAAHKALATGLHRDLGQFNVVLGSAKHDTSRTRERQSTFWSLYSHERHLSLPLGRPASINDMDVDIPDPSYNKVLQASVELARISQKVHYNYVRTRGASVVNFCSKVREISSELLRFHQNLPLELQFPLSRYESENSKGKWSTSQFGLAIEFFHLMTVVLRPCLIIDAIRRRVFHASDNINLSIPDEWVSWLEETCNLCRTASTHIIYLYSDAKTSNPIISRMRYGRFFIEAACFVLLFDLLRDPTTTTSSKGFETIAEGIDCFMRIPADRILLISAEAISKMLDLTRELVAVQNDSLQLGHPSDISRSAGAQTGTLLSPAYESLNIRLAENMEAEVETKGKVWNEDVFASNFWLFANVDPILTDLN